MLDSRRPCRGRRTAFKHRSTTSAMRARRCGCSGLRMTGSPELRSPISAVASATRRLAAAERARRHRTRSPGHFEKVLSWRAMRARVEHMSGKKLFCLSSLLILPFFYVLFYCARLVMRGQPMEEALKWEGLLLLVTLIVLERVYTYKYSVSQKQVLARDITATIVNKYVTGFVTAALVVPILVYVPQHFLGRKYFLASPDQLGPFWLQVLLIVFSVSFFRYWMHRWQHSNEFLWSLHSYHHQVKDLQALNTYVSHPIDFALRNVLVYLVLGIIGFDPLVLLLAVPATNVSGTFSHCGADLKAGPLNYFLVTPEVHRWHHSAEVPEGHKYSCNYGVEFSFWDILFGTFYLPQKDGVTLQPERIGHPSGRADEPNYLKLLLVPLRLYPSSSLKRRRPVAN